MCIYIYAHNYYISPWHSREYILHMSILYIHTHIYISLAFQGIHTTYKCVTYTETQIYIYIYIILCISLAFGGLYSYASLPHVSGRLICLLNTDSDSALLFFPEVLFDSSLLCLMPCVSPMTLRIFLGKFPTSTPV